MLIRCKRCNQKVFVFTFEDKNLCRNCLRAITVARNLAPVDPLKPLEPRKPLPFKYSDAKRDHHRGKVEKSKPGVNRDYSGISKKAAGTKRSHSDMGTHGTQERPKRVRAMDEEPSPTAFDDTPSIVRPNTLRLQCMTLFIPFDAGKNIYKQNAGKGTFQADFIPRPDNVFSPFTQPTVQTPLSAFNTKVFPGQSLFEPKARAMTDKEIGDHYNEIVDKHIRACTDWKLWEAVHARREFTMHLQLSELCPEVIFLSEQLKDAPFPDMLQPCPQLKYRKIGSLKALLGDKNVDHKNEIAAYVLKDEMSATQVLFDARALIRKSGKTKTEKWLTVQKIALPNVYVEVAGVHLDADYTGHTSKAAKEKTLQEVGQFARDQGIDALLGDLNMDSFELSGGFFPNDYSFAKTDGPSGTFNPKYTFSHSNSNSQNNYMGGMIVNLEQVETEPMHWLGHDTIALSRTLDGEFYSDHPAIMANYVKSFT
ncbi:hypothetical protein ACN469_38195 [Corallococcus terminator]